ncbi:MAG: hypothetical protein QW692_04255 [Nitrososphaerota archaeon]
MIEEILIWFLVIFSADLCATLIEHFILARRKTFKRRKRFEPMIYRLIRKLLNPR